MKNFHHIIPLLILAGLFCGCSTTTYTHGVPNLAQVSHGVYRGGQPTAEGWKYLHDNLGVMYDIKLNPDSEGSDNQAAQDGMVVVKFPISFEQQIFGPATNQIEGAVGVINILQGFPLPVFVHCAHGQDRTGEIVAVYRREVNGWSKQRARQEMLEHGFHRSLLGLDWYWREKVK